jgi:replicative DNA helicase
MISTLNYKPRVVPKEIEGKIAECAINAYAEYAYTLEQLSPDEVFYPEYGRILGLAQKVYRAGGEVNMLSIYEASGQSEEVMGDLMATTRLCASYVPTESMVVRVKEAARHRRITIKMLQAIEDKPEDMLPVLERIVEEERKNDTRAQDADAEYREYIESLRQPLDKTRLQTGFTKLDKTIGWLPIGSVSCIGARTSVGKTSFAINVGIRQAKAGKNVMLASLEMSREQIYDRMTAMVSGVPYEAMRDHTLTEQQYMEVTETERIILDYPGRIKIYDNLFSIEAIIRAAAKHRPELLIIDFLQYVTGEGKDERAVMDNAVRRIKQAARIYNIHIMMLSQLNRDAEDDKEKDEAPRKPRLKHLKGCGGIEEGSDIVILLHRPRGTAAPEIDYIVAKNKYGKTGIIHGTFNGALQRMTEAA